MQNKSIQETVEILKQEITALKHKTEIYTNRCKFHHHNKFFETIQKQFYNKLNEKRQGETTSKPDDKATMELWSNI